VRHRQAGIHRDARTSGRGFVPSISVTPDALLESTRRTRGFGRAVYTIRPARYHPLPHPIQTSPKHQMRAEIEQLSDAAKQSIGLLRRHL
jgi:hypothetical protein